MSESESYVTTDGQSASLSWNKAPIWDLRPGFCYRQTVARLLTWGALSDERTAVVDGYVITMLSHSIKYVERCFRQTIFSFSFVVHREHAVM
jgi:hypothetical protein